MNITLKNLNGFVSNTNEIKALEFETHKDLMSWKRALISPHTLCPEEVRGTIFVGCSSGTTVIEKLWHLMSNSGPLLPSNLLQLIQTVGR